MGAAAFGAFQPISIEGRTRLARLTAAAAALFVLLALLTILSQMNELLGAGGLPSLSMIVLFLRATALGRSWAWRLGLTVLSALLLAVLPAWKRSTWRVATLAALAALYPVAAVSHTARAVDLRWLFILLDWVHLATISLWFGGLVVLGFPSLSEGPAAFSHQLNRFSAMAMVLVPVAVASGAFLMQNTLDTANDLVTFDYGQALVAKHLFLIPVLGLAGYTMLVVKPRLAAYRTQELMRRAKQNIRAEALLVLGMFASTAFLSREVPPSHIGMAGPDALEGVYALSRPALLPVGGGDRCRGRTPGALDAPLRPVAGFDRRRRGARSRPLHGALEPDRRP